MADKVLSLELMKDSFYIQWHVTNVCNLRCKHCYQEDFSKAGELDWPGLKRISDNILAAIHGWNKTATIHLTGGEPLLKRETFLLLDELDRESNVAELGIITNGLLIRDEVIGRLSRFSKLKTIKVSLDGSSAEIHDSLRSQGSFEKVMRNLLLIRKHERFDLILMFTAMRRNYRSLLSVLDLCQDAGVDGVIIERFIPWGRGREIMGEVLSQTQWKEMIEGLFEYFSAGMETREGVPYQAFQVSFDRAGRGEMDLAGAPCVIGKDGLCIMPEGGVFPCRRFPVAIGNLLDDSLETIWEKSEILEKLRRKENLKGRCGNCSVKDCRGCRSLVLCLTGDYLAEDPHCWHSLE